MTNELKKAREERGWTQQQAAAHLGVTQAYLSMLERGRRNVTPLARKPMNTYGLAPTVLPVREVRGNSSPDFLARSLAVLGYPGFAHLRNGGRKMNPAEFLLRALAQNTLDARTAEGLPWVVVQYRDLPADLLVQEARSHNLQNRLGFVVTLGRLAASRDDLLPLERTLADSKLAKEDSFCQELSEPERRWLRDNSSTQAREWHLLSDMRPEMLRYV